MAKLKTESSAKALKRRAKQARSKATVEAIVEASAQILSRDGVAGLNTNAIAKRAGVSVGSVYEYFSNKREIVDLLLDRHLSEGETALLEGAALLSEDLSPRDVVGTLVAGAIRLHQNDPKLHRALSSEIALTEAQQQRIDNLRTGLIQAIAAALAPAVDEAQIKATMLVDTADALAHRWIVDEVGSLIPAERLTEEMTKMLTSYIEAP